MSKKNYPYLAYHSSAQVPQNEGVASSASNMLLASCVLAPCMCSAAMLSLLPAPRA